MFAVIDEVKTSMKWHGVSVRSVVMYMTMVPFFVTGIAAMAYALGLAYFFVLPASHWFVYEKLQTQENVYPVGVERIFAKSYVDWRQDGLLLEWTDELQCKTIDGDFATIGTLETSGHRDGQDQTVRPHMWQLGIKHPMFETECRIEATIDLKLKNGLTKRQHITSNTYRLVNQ